MTGLCILIIDDHDLFRTGMDMILKQDDRIETVLEAGSVMDALKHNQSDIDLILLDIQMPGLDGLNGIKILKEHFAVPIIMLSDSNLTDDMCDALNSGAVGFLPKSSSAKMIIEAIMLAMDGTECFPKDKDLTKKNNETTIELTARQHQVLSLLCEGKPNKVIARDLDLSENTVRVHVSAILSILNVSSRSEAILVAQKRKLVRVN
ncbi:MAG: response regulator transcription factor [Pseudomonadota bacterium]